MPSSLLRLRALLLVVALLVANVTLPAGELQVGFAAIDITPPLDSGRPVFLAGQESNRRATSVHDPLFARAAVLASGGRRFALVSVDLIGVQYPLVKAVRSRLGDFDYVLVASTHNHEGPDVVGIWGPSPGESGVDPEYLSELEQKIARAVQQAAGDLKPVTAAYGTADDVSLVADYRLPKVYDSVLRVVRFDAGNKPAGALVQWNSHPVEPDGNHALTADFIGMTVARLERDLQCPVVYFTGANGGLMGSPDKTFREKYAAEIAGDAFNFMRVYAREVAELAKRASQTAENIELTPLAAFVRSVAVPLDNVGYRQARRAGVLTRPAFRPTDDPDALGEAVAAEVLDGPQVVETEVGYLRLGELHVATIPGELYPELVYGEFPQQAEAGVDFPSAALEPTVMDILPGGRALIVGLANDEVGYIIPKRQWDVKPPFAYDRTSPQYGEVNSLGPETASVLMKALERRVSEASENNGSD